MALQKTIEESNYFCHSLSDSLSTVPTTGTTKHISEQDVLDVATATAFVFRGYINSPYLFSKFLLGEVRSKSIDAYRFGRVYGSKSTDLQEMLTAFMNKLEIADSMGTLETILNESLDQSLSEVKEHKQSFFRGWR